MSSRGKQEDQPSFDVETTQAIAHAFEQVCKHLCDQGQPEIVREVISEKVINAAKGGERDPAQLRDIVLASFGFRGDAV